MSYKHFNIPVFIPELACPFQCIYCNQKKISGRQAVPDPDDIFETIESHLKTIPNEATDIQLAYFGGNFTGLSIPDQQAYLQLVQPYIKQGQISGIRLSTRPDYINQEILDLLKRHHVCSIELGAQSMDDDVLKLSKRGHTAADTQKASRLILENGFKLGLQMMIGLPGDTLEKATYTAQRIIDLKATETRIYPTLVIRDTLLEQHYLEGKYTPLSLEEAVVWSAQLLQIFEDAGIKVLRIGLHPSEGLLTGTELVAGPFHPSFRELVLTDIWRRQLEPLLNREGESIRIEVPANEIQYAIGYGNANRNMLMKAFKKVTFISSKFMKKGHFKISSLSGNQ